MADRLDNKLRDIEVALGGPETRPESYYTAYDKLEWHLDYIEELVQEGGTGGGGKVDDVQVNGTSVLDEDKVANIELKTINGNEVAGEGNLSITTYQAFPTSWPTDNQHTTKQFCDAIDADNTAVIGMGYFGGAMWSDKPSGLTNGDVVVEITEGPSSTKSIHLIMTSSSVYPYRWEYTYWSHGSVSGWRGVQPEINSSNKLSASYVTGLSTVATSGSYNDLSNKLTAGNGISITGNAITVDSSIVALQEDLPTGTLDINFNGTATGTTTALTNIVVGSTTYTVSSGASVQNLTSNTAVTLNASAFSTLVSSHIHIASSPTMTGLDSAYDFVKIKLSISSTNYLVVMTKNDTNKYSGMFFVENGGYLYELSAYYNGSKLILRCATVGQIGSNNGGSN